MTPPGRLIPQLSRLEKKISIEGDDCLEPGPHPLPLQSKTDALDRTTILAPDLFSIFNIKNMLTGEVWCKNWGKLREINIWLADSSENKTFHVWNSDATVMMDKKF